MWETWANAHYLGPAETALTPEERQIIYTEAWVTYDAMGDIRKRFQ